MFGMRRKAYCKNKNSIKLRDSLSIKMIVKVHKTGDGRKIVAVCDKDLLGKKFEEGKLQLDLASNFYKGDEKEEEEIIKILNDGNIINFVGKKSINLGLKQGIIAKNNIIRIKKIPHAQAILN